MTRPFWKDCKGMLWARAAGDMTVLYFYPLQRGFYLTDEYAEDLGLVDPETGEVLPEDERVGKCVPWMDNLAAYRTGRSHLRGLPRRRAEPEVYPVGYHVRWPELPALLNVGETVYQRAKGGVSGVAAKSRSRASMTTWRRRRWDNDAGVIAMAPGRRQQSLAQLIDPLAEVEVELPVGSRSSRGLPTDITTQRLLYRRRHRDRRQCRLPEPGAAVLAAQPHRVRRHRGRSRRRRRANGSWSSRATTTAPRPSTSRAIRCCC